MSKIVKRIMFEFRNWFSKEPTLFFNIYGLKKYNKALFITPDTQLVVNAYPRCGNTFFHYAMLHKNPNLMMAHHLHVPALTLQGIKLNKPNVVIVRNPVDAIVSFVIREPHVTLKQAISAYQIFHETLLPYKHKILFVDFKLMISDFSQIISQINSKFSLQLNNYEAFSNEDNEIIFKDIETIDKQLNGNVKEGRVSRPTEGAEYSLEKARLKEKLVNQYANKIAKCNSLYLQTLS